MFGSKKAKKDFIRRLSVHLRDMDIIVTRDKTPVSWWIRKQTTSLWSHVLLAGADGVGYSTGVSGFPFWRYGVVELDEYLAGKDFMIIRLRDLTDTQRAMGMTAINEEIGKPYPMTDPISMWIQNMFAPGAYKLKVNSAARICADSVAWTYERMGRELAPHLELDTSMMTPQRCIEDHMAEDVAGWDGHGWVGPLLKDFTL